MTPKMNAWNPEESAIRAQAVGRLEAIPASRRPGTNLAHLGRPNSCLDTHEIAACRHEIAQRCLIGALRSCVGVAARGVIQPTAHAFGESATIAGPRGIGA
jgi:hypothetical protein